MADNKHTEILRRMARDRNDEVMENPLTSSRAIRMALTKAANDSVGLVLRVSSIEEDVFQLDDMLADLDDDLMLVALTRKDDLIGVLALDVEMRAAILEMATIGSLLTAKSENRMSTCTDKTMCDPVLNAFVHALPAAVIGTDLESWADGVMSDQRFESSRAAGLVLNDCRYRVVRLGVDLGVAERQGMILLGLPPVAQAVDTVVETVEAVDWETLFQAAVAQAPSELNALLHRFDMSLAHIETLKIGQIVPLSGCTVGSIKLMSSDGKKVAEAKLGQIGGMRAVRIEAAPAQLMADLAAPIQTHLSGGRNSMAVVKQAVTNSQKPTIDRTGLALPEKT